MSLDCARVLHDSLLVPFLIYVSETMIWRWKDSSRIRVVQMGNIRGLLGIRRMYEVLNVRVEELCGVTKGVDERIDEGIL